MAKTAFRTWQVGELVTASMLNAQIRDNGNEIWKGTANGDMDFYTSSTTKTRIPIGTTGDVLSVKNGVPTWSSAVAVRVYQYPTTTSAISGSLVEITSFNLEETDWNGFHTGTNNYLQIPTGFDGFYLVGCGGYWDDTVTSVGKMLRIGIKVDATIDHQSTYSSIANDYVYQEANTFMQLIAGQQIKMVIQQKTTTTVLFKEAFMYLVKVK